MLVYVLIAIQLIHAYLMLSYAFLAHVFILIVILLLLVVVSIVISIVDVVCCSSFILASLAVFISLRSLYGVTFSNMAEVLRSRRLIYFVNTSQKPFHL